MNPVTQALLKELKDPELNNFVGDWDTLNDLIIEIFKQKSTTFEQQETYFQVQEKLQTSYAKLKEQLEPFWRASRVKDGLSVGDPFAALIEKRSAKEFVENWDAMRTLPAAREALNQMLMAKIENKK